MKDRLPTATDFVKRYDAPILPFRALPPSCQMAIIWYMYVDGDAWEAPYDDAGYIRDAKEMERTYKAEIRRNLAKWVEKYGKTEWGLVKFPTKDLTAYVWRCMSEKGTWGDEFDSWKDYHEWYLQDALVGSGKRHNMKDRWPCIFSLGKTFAEDPIEDGWHRFHAYVRAKHPTVPCVFAWNLLDSVRQL